LYCDGSAGPLTSTLAGVSDKLCRVPKPPGRLAISVRAMEAVAKP
jgi:hypothetical protein